MKKASVILTLGILAAFIAMYLVGALAPRVTAQSSFPAARIRVDYIPEPRNIVWSSTNRPPFVVPEGRVLIITEVVNNSASIPNVQILANGDSNDVRYQCRAIGATNLGTGIPFTSNETVDISAGSDTAFWYGYLQ